ncbi:NAD(P)-binding protein [Aspergillus crustosus]
MAPLNISSEKLLITGVTGYIGFKVLLIALERGYSVRALVRKESHIADIEKKSAAIADASKSGKLEFAIVPDFLAKDAVYNVLQGITVIVHLASPLAIQTEKFQEELIDPAVSMVTVFLEAAERVKSVRRVIVTSSCVTLIPFEWNFNPDSETIYTPKDLNPSLSATPTSSMEAYWISKGLARKTTHDFIASNKPSFDFVNLLAGVVIGPDDRHIPSETNGPIPASILFEGTRTSVLAPALTADLNSPFPYVNVPVHVTDVAKSHVDAIDSDLVPGNTEYILASDTPEGVNWDEDVHRVAKKYFADDVASGLLKLEGSLTTIKWRLDASETEKVFGWKHTNFEETMRGLIAQYLELKKAEK